MQGLAVKSALRTFEVLELFKETRRPMRLNEIYTSLGYPQSSTTNLLKSMVMTGYLNFNRKTRMYIPTMRVNDLGSWLPSYIHQDGALKAMVQQVQRETDETVGLVAQNDLFIQYVMLLTPDHEFKAAPEQGDMRLMIDSSTGVAMLSKMSDRTIEKLYRYTKYYYPGLEYFADFDELMKEIRWVRFIKSVYLPKLPTPNVSSIAIPMEVEGNGIPLALGVGGFADRIHAKRKDILQSMQDALADFQAGRFVDDSAPMAAE
ncbi:IclR family transcriptional regulator [Pseudooceanicola nitratireducens]|uniref:IclR family transcriptional regulator n=1 Tax=Pseudooceanicola nitratireducens TaxID=517719 RepID=UPI0023F4FA0B|nr:helix-turn-helix domain-containing protein [Pseudooceanicola nitratireducens]